MSQMSQQNSSCEWTFFDRSKARFTAGATTRPSGSDSLRCGRSASLRAFTDRGRIPQTMIEDAKVKIIAKAGFGFGDVNSCMIFKKWEE